MTAAPFSGFGVDVFVQIQNTGNIKLENISLEDDPAITFTPVTISEGTNTHTPIGLRTVPCYRTRRRILRAAIQLQGLTVTRLIFAWLLSQTEWT